MVEGLEQGSGWLGFAHQAFGRQVVPAAHENRRYRVGRLSQFRAEFKPAHPRQVEVREDARAASRRFDGKECFRAVEDCHIEAQEV